MSLITIPRKLGKQKAFHDPRTLCLANYIDSNILPPAPTAVDYSTVVSSWPMFKNDQIGNCTCAGAGHLIQEWTAEAGHLYTPTDDQIITAYSAITGYDPATGNNDNGAVEMEVLKYWQNTGIAGHKIGAFVALQPQDVNHIKDAIYLFDGCYIGVSLPLSAQNQTIWSVPPGGAVGQGSPGSWGGHCVPVVGYNDREIIFISWGMVMKMTWQFWSIYCDEAYAILSPDFFNEKSQSTLGFNIDQLTADLKAVQN